MAKIQLDYLTVDELATRWDCSTNEIIHAVIRGKLVPSTFLEQVRAIPFLGGDRIGDDFNGTFDHPDLDKPGDDSDVPLYGMFYLHSPKQRGIDACDFSCASLEQNPKSADSWYMLLDDIPLTDASLVFFIDEIIRFEQENFNDADQKKSIPKDKPLSTVERNTLLKIIAALCDYSDIKHQERGAATQIARMTEEIGAAVTDDTIRKVLAKIPEAL